jgi:hypothetical protein
MLTLRFGQAGAVGLSAWVSTRNVGSLPARNVSSSLSCVRSGFGVVPGASFGRLATWGFRALIAASSWSWNLSVRSSIAAAAKTLARFWAEVAVEAVAVIASTLLPATGSAVMSFRSERAVRSVLSFSLASLATSIVVTSREAVWTSRVGSLEAWMRPGMLFKVVSVPATGETRRSASAL